MEISNQTNNYQMMNSLQQPNNSIQPVPTRPEQDPQMGTKDVYEASQGNLIRNDDGDLALTPQGQVNVDHKQEANAAEIAAEEQAKKDAQRGFATDALAHQSKQTQVEIYLSVATDSKVTIDNGMSDSIEALRDIQKQNNTVQSYAAYEENQKGGFATFY